MKSVTMWPKSAPKLVPCAVCAQTGFADRVWRDAWTMEPREKICPECHGRGWVTPDKVGR